MLRVQITKYKYFLEQDFSTLEDAQEEGFETGFDYTVYANGVPIGEYTCRGGWQLLVPPNAVEFCVEATRGNAAPDPQVVVDAKRLTRYSKKVIRRHPFLKETFVNKYSNTDQTYLSPLQNAAVLGYLIGRLDGEGKSLDREVLYLTLQRRFGITYSEIHQFMESNWETTL